MSATSNHAGFWIRFLGMLIDFIPLVALSWFFFPETISTTDSQYTISYNGVHFLIPLLYWGLQWALFSRSLSGFLLGIKLVNREEESISVIQALVRAPLAIVLFVFFPLAAFTPDKRGLPDYITGTWVAKS